MELDLDGEDETTFAAAADVVQQNSLGIDGKKKLDEKTLLELYGLYKVATIGKCNESQPGIFNVKARAKWSAWKQVSDLSNEVAKMKYVEKVERLFNWTANRSTCSSSNIEMPQTKGSASLIGNNVSSFAFPTETEDEDDLHSDPVFSWAKDCDILKLDQWAKNASDVNIKDKNGLTPLHWAADRGHMAACKLLLEHGADPSLSDNDGTTPLEYAETCEYEDIVALLNQHIKP